MERLFVIVDEEFMAVSVPGPWQGFVNTCLYRTELEEMPPSG